MKFNLPGIAFLALALAGPGSADNERLRITDASGEPYDRFGQSLSADGSTVLIGAPGDVGGGGNNSGRVFLHDAVTGAKLGWLVALDANTGDGFGSATDIDGTLAIVGTPGDNLKGKIDAGSAYLFDVASGQQIFKLKASDKAEGDRFGGSVAIDGGTAIVGAYWNDDLGEQSGAAYLFDTATGQETAKLLPSDGGPFDTFGGSVAIRGSIALVGAPYNNNGAVYVFDTTTGLQIDKLEPTGVTNGISFGISLALEGTTAVIGAWSDNGNELGSGSAYLFDVTTGQEIDKLLAPDGETSDNFGISVDIDSSRVLVGAIRATGEAHDSGAAYLFDRDTGQPLAKLASSDSPYDDSFGQSVALAATTLFVGSHGNYEKEEFAGAVYLFDVPAATGGSYCGPAVPNSSGAAAEIAAFGTEYVSCNCVRLDATGMPVQEFGYFLNGMSQGFVQPPGSQGILCLSGGIGRHNQDVLSTGGGGEFSLQLDLENIPTPGGLRAVLPGETWYWQAWFRDQNPGNTSNFTDGVGVTFR